MRQRASRALALKTRPEKAVAQLLLPAEEVAVMPWPEETEEMEKVSPVAALALAEPPPRLAQQQSRWWPIS